jgi:hypothetical protein
MVMLSATVSLVLMLKEPLDNVLVLFPKAPLASPSNCALPLLVIVTTVALSVVTLLPLASLAVTVVLNVAPAVSDVVALTT